MSSRRRLSSTASFPFPASRPRDRRWTRQCLFRRRCGAIADIRNYTRNTTGHRLPDHVRESLAVGGRGDHHVDHAVNFRHSGLSRQPLHACTESRLLHQPCHLPSVCVVSSPDAEKACGRLLPLQQSRGADERLLPLHGIKTAYQRNGISDCAIPNRARISARLCGRGRNLSVSMPLSTAMLRCLGYPCAR